MIAEIAPKGDYRTINDYRFVDKNVDTAGEAYYFLRQVDFDGKSTDYDVKSIKFESEKSISAYPNPANNRLYIESGDNEEAVVTIYNSMGSAVYQNQASFPMDLDVTDIPMGVYTMVIESENSVKTIRQVFN